MHAGHRLHAAFPVPPATEIVACLARGLNWALAFIAYAAAARSGDHAARLNATYAWIRRSVLRLDRLFLRLAAGASLAPRPRAPRPRAAVRAPRHGPVRLLSPGALLRYIPTLGHGNGPLAQFLESPECQALLSAAPQAGRILRPLCRLYAVPLPPALHLPPRPRRIPPRAAPPPPDPPRDPALPPPKYPDGRAMRRYSPGKTPDWAGRQRS